jgi:hypothetical protein
MYSNVLQGTLHPLVFCKQPQPIEKPLIKRGLTGKLIKSDKELYAFSIRFPLMNVSRGTLYNFGEWAR